MSARTRIAAFVMLVATLAAVAYADLRYSRDVEIETFTYDGELWLRTEVLVGPVNGTLSRQQVAMRVKDLAELGDVMDKARRER